MQCSERPASDGPPESQRRPVFAFSTRPEPPSSDVAMLLLEGALPAGTRSSRAVARELVVVCPDAMALSWWVAPESGWRRPPDHSYDAVCLADRFANPGEVADGLSTGVRKLRVVAPGSRETERYLRRLFAAAGCTLPFPIQDFEDALREAGASARACVNSTNEIGLLAMSSNTASGARRAMTILRGVARYVALLAAETEGEHPSAAKPTAASSTISARKVTASGSR